MPYRIIGQAAPFNVVNSYREIFLPGAFDEFLATPEARKLPMNLGHDDKPDVGVWNHLHVAGDWLYCEGVLDDRETEYKVRHGLDQLSIGYSNADTVDAARAAKNSKEYADALLPGRVGRGIEYIAKRLSQMPAAEAKAKVREIIEAPHDWARILIMQAAQENDTIERVTRARLNEISIVEHGSFKDTRLHWEQI